MSKIETGAYSSLLRRFLLMKGESNVCDELAPEISPVFVLEDDRPDWEFLKGARLMAWTQNQPSGGAGFFNSARLRNPTASGIIATVTRVEGGCIGGGNAAITMLFGAQTADLATTSGNVPRDGRMIPPVGGAIITSFGNLAGGGNAVDLILTGTGGGSQPMGSIYVIPPGFALTMTISLDNQPLTSAFHWVERRLDDLERP